MSNVSKVQNWFIWIANGRIFRHAFVVFACFFYLGPHEEITITAPESNATEGVAQYIICSVLYKCKKNMPTIVWNYSDMHSSFSAQNIHSDTFVAQSNLTFIGSLDDDGKTLTCTAQFITGKTSCFRTIHVKSEYTKEDKQWGFFGGVSSKIVNDFVFVGFVLFFQNMKNHMRKLKQMKVCPDSSC